MLQHSMHEWGLVTGACASAGASWDVHAFDAWGAKRERAHQRGHPGMCTHSTHGVLSKSITPFTTLCEIYINISCCSRFGVSHNRHVSGDNANYVSVMCVCICAVAHIITLHIQVLIACLWASLSNMSPSRIFILCIIHYNASLGCGIYTLYHSLEW